MTRCVLFWPDTHFPHQDEAAVACAKRIVRLIKPHTVVMLGDVLDAAAFSAHSLNGFADRETAGRDFYSSEIVPAQELLNFLSVTSRIVFIEGNHEHRVERTAVRLGAAVSSVYSLVSPQALLSAGRSAKRFRWIPYGIDPARSSYRVTPNLLAIHGWSTAKAAASKHLELARNYSVVFGHCHRAQSDTRRDPISNEVFKAVSPGCLSKLEPLYTHGRPTNWVHGVSLAYIRKDGGHTLYNVLIERGQAVLPNGKLVRG